jgi:bifunctional non-homologous end joining protein LigD
VARPARAKQADRETLLAQAQEAPLPKKLAPQLATLVSAVPPGEWVVKNKLDGYRMLARIERGKVQLFTRNGHDWTARLQPIADALGALDLDSAWLDTEIVAPNEDGVPDFSKLQNSIDSARTKDIVMFVFDVPFLNGMDLRAVPLINRRAVVQELLQGVESEIVRFNESFEASPSALLSAACRLGLEGVMVKRADASYVSGRTETWLKLKCQHRQDSWWLDSPTAPAQAGRSEGCCSVTTKGVNCVSPVPWAPVGVRRRGASCTSC